ncbi:LacI family DNA-binding transcriptional regulator [Alteraurantiacibacter buctensis]|uniref:LacI family DNA-binding transcriptional regulator n=1 Tax=Alteraurantiacibacter buctensis TaxID=1503981 RepID=UPI00301D7DC7
MVDEGASDNRRKQRGARRRAGAPTISDVAREANCSPMTVSRVINGEGNVRDATREQVLEAIARLNYSPNRAARSLAGGEQARVALLFDNPSSSYLAEFLMGALDEANRRDIQLVVQSCDDVAHGKALIRHLAEGGIQGFILPPPAVRRCIRAGTGERAGCHFHRRRIGQGCRFAGRSADRRFPGRL